VCSTNLAVANEKISPEEIQEFVDKKILLVTGSDSVLVSKRGGWMFLGCLTNEAERKVALLEVNEKLFSGGEYVLARCWKGFLFISVPEKQKRGKFSDT
jgi:hypothetical protein